MEVLACLVLEELEQSIGSILNTCTLGLRADLAEMAIELIWGIEFSDPA